MRVGLLRRLGCWALCVCAGTDAVGCAPRTCGWTLCYARPGSAGSWSSWTPRLSPHLRLPSPPSRRGSWALRERSGARSPSIPTPESEPPTACPRDTPSRPAASEPNPWAEPCLLPPQQLWVIRVRDALRRRQSDGRCPRRSLTHVAGLTLQQRGRWQNNKRARLAGVDAAEIERVGLWLLQGWDTPLFDFSEASSQSSPTRAIRTPVSTHRCPGSTSSAPSEFAEFSNLYFDARYDVLGTAPRWACKG